MSFNDQSQQQSIYDNTIFNELDGYAVISPSSSSQFSGRSGHVDLSSWSPHQSSFSANLYDTYVHHPQPSSHLHIHSANTSPHHSTARNDAQSIVTGTDGAATSSSKALSPLPFIPSSSSSSPLNHQMDPLYYRGEQKLSEHHGSSYFDDALFNYPIPPSTIALTPLAHHEHPSHHSHSTTHDFTLDFHHYDRNESARIRQPLPQGALLPPLSFDPPMHAAAQDLVNPASYNGHQLLSPFVEHSALSPSVSVHYKGHTSSPEEFILHRRLSNEMDPRQALFTNLSEGSVYSLSASPVIEKTSGSASLYQTSHLPTTPTAGYSPHHVASSQTVISPGSSVLSSPVTQRSVASHPTPAVSPVIAQHPMVGRTAGPAVKNVLASPDHKSVDTKALVQEPATPAESTSQSPTQQTGSAATKEKAKADFQCPGCDLTFGRLSALKQHMLSHTGEKPHACDLCGRRFSLASNLRRHTSTKACRVMKFETAKQSATVSGTVASPTIASVSTSPVIPTATPRSGTTTVTGSVTVTPTASVAPSSPSDSPAKLRTKRKAPAETKVVRRKRHANQEERWIPRTLALFKNAHLLTSTPPFQFCISRNAQGEETEALPFTKPTLPLHPVRPSVRGHRSRLSTSSSITSESSFEDSTGPSDSSRRGSFEEDDSDYEERDSYEAAPEYPYHPSSWDEQWGKLPGPGLLGSDELVKRASVARRWMTFRM